jgi:hypothetical protein
MIQTVADVVDPLRTGSWSPKMPALRPEAVVDVIAYQVNSFSVLKDFYSTVRWHQGVIGVEDMAFKQGALFLRLNCSEPSAAIGALMEQSTFNLRLLSCNSNSIEVMLGDSN